MDTMERKKDINSLRIDNKRLIDDAVLFLIDWLTGNNIEFTRTRFNVIRYRENSIGKSVYFHNVDRVGFLNPIFMTVLGVGVSKRNESIYSKENFKLCYVGLVETLMIPYPKVELGVVMINPVYILKT